MPLDNASSGLLPVLLKISSGEGEIFGIEEKSGATGGE